jgi:hypothetical protein
VTSAPRWARGCCSYTHNTPPPPPHNTNQLISSMSALFLQAGDIRTSLGSGLLQLGIPPPPAWASAAQHRQASFWLSAPRCLFLQAGDIRTWLGSVLSYVSAPMNTSDVPPSALLRHCFLHFLHNSGWRHPHLAGQWSAAAGHPPHLQPGPVQRQLQGVGAAGRSSARVQHGQRATV